MSSGPSPHGEREAAQAPDGVTGMLLAWRAGEPGALDALLPLVYAELHRQAERALRREATGHTLQPTALVNEAYLRLVDQSRVSWQNRAQFFGVAARCMRRILVDHARARGAAKRGGPGVRAGLDDADAAIDEPASLVAAVHEALERLAVLDPEQARLVELRYFGGLTMEEIADVLKVHVNTVTREWSAARAWLFATLSGEEMDAI